MDLVEFEDGVTNDGIALFKTVKAFRGAKEDLVASSLTDRQKIFTRG